MATNYTFKEFATNIVECEDPRILSDMGGRYPLLYGELNRIAALDEGIVLSVANMMPDYVNARKANKTIEANMLGVGGDSEEDVEDEPAEEPAEEEKPKKRAAKKAEPVVEDDDEDKDDAEDGGAYDGKPAPELFKMCKARKIKAAPKKPAKYYIELLEKADEADAKADVDADEDDDWDI